MSTIFLFSKICWQLIAIFYLYTSKKFPAHNLNFHWRWRWRIESRLPFKVFSTLKWQVLSLQRAPENSPLPPSVLVLYDLFYFSMIKIQTYLYHTIEPSLGVWLVFSPFLALSPHLCRISSPQSWRSFYQLSLCS